MSWSISITNLFTFSRHEQHWQYWVRLRCKYLLCWIWPYNQYLIWILFFCPLEWWKQTSCSGQGKKLVIFASLAHLNAPCKYSLWEKNRRCGKNWQSVDYVFSDKCHPCLQLRAKINYEGRSSTWSSRRLFKSASDSHLMTHVWSRSTATMEGSVKS